MTTCMMLDKLRVHSLGAIAAMVPSRVPGELSVLKACL